MEILLQDWIEVLISVLKDDLILIAPRRAAPRRR